MGFHGDGHDDGAPAWWPWSPACRGVSAAPPGMWLSPRPNVPIVSSGMLRLGSSSCLSSSYQLDWWAFCSAENQSKARKQFRKKVTEKEAREEFGFGSTEEVPKAAVTVRRRIHREAPSSEIAKRDLQEFLGCQLDDDEDFETPPVSQIH